MYTSLAGDNYHLLWPMGCGNLFPWHCLLLVVPFGFAAHGESVSVVVC